MGTQTLIEFSHTLGRHINGKTSLGGNLATSGRAASQRPRLHVPPHMTSQANTQSITGDNHGSIVCNVRKWKQSKRPSTAATIRETKKCDMFIQINTTWQFKPRKRSVTLRVDSMWRGHKCRTVTVPANTSSALDIPHYSKHRTYVSLHNPQNNPTREF